MTWIRTAVKSLHLLILLLVCSLGFYTPGVRSQQSHSASPRQDDKTGALTVVQSDEQDDGVQITELDEQISIENPEPFVATNEWQSIKPGQAIPKGLHVRMNVQTGEREARLLQEDQPRRHDREENLAQTLEQEYTYDELKQAVKAMKSEKFKSVDMETLQKEKEFRSYEELKEDMEKMYTDVKTDAEIITDLVEKFRSASQAMDDVVPILTELEYYLHQIDNALLFCDLGAMPVLLKCFNSSVEGVRSEAALTLGSALQSNPKAQVSAVENGAIQEILRVLAIDSSERVRKRAIYALSTMIRLFPYAQKRFLELGGLSVLGKFFEDKSAQVQQIRAITLITDMIKEKKQHTAADDVNLEHEDSTQKERRRQYQLVNLQEVAVKSGWCSLVPKLLQHPGHDNREQVMVSMEILLPDCRAEFRKVVPVLQSLRQEYSDLLSQEQAEGEDDDGFFQGMVSMADSLLAGLSSTREEL